MKETEHDVNYLNTLSNLTIFCHPYLDSHQYLKAQDFRIHGNFCLVIIKQLALVHVKESFQIIKKASKISTVLKVANFTHDRRHIIIFSSAFSHPTR